MPVASVQAPKRPRQAGPMLRIRGLRLDGPSVRCATDGEDILVPRVPASYLCPGDDICVGASGTPIRECLATQNGLHRKARQLYFGRIGYARYATPPRMFSSIRKRLVTPKVDAVGAVSCISPAAPLEEIK